MNRRLAAALLLVPLLTAAGCTIGSSDRTAAPGASTSTSPFADCTTLTTPPSAAPASTGSPDPTVPPASAAGSAGPTASAGTGPTVTAGPPTPANTPATTAPSGGGSPDGTGRLLPDLRFACFTGGAEVALREVRGPAVLNLWASWCAPCRKELPAFQRLSDRMAGQAHVIGVNTYDDRSRAVSVGEDFGVTFPSLVDTDQRLQRELAPNVLPVTIFVDGQGRIRHQDVSGALDDARLAELVRRHLGLEVPA
ncbi:TlpA family protein disulfide reductase [Micromonospora cathayae]|uniref:Redoxin family protein n=1 Tax=Micromonospora cathayae TaxID=3028804 RepID=A0ABY7ZTA9_9ACTN|nr:redoxin domain-containing protein [Micromonospora sp. HUAS 3]WDZ85728.1 redoxin family protein [Micromonospora sp. HUAS 3]